MVRLLYITKSCNVHDLRILTALGDCGFELGVLSLDSPEIKLEQQHPSIRYLGCLSIGGLIDYENPGSALELINIEARNFKPNLILAGPVHTAGWLAVKAKIDLPCVIQSWAFDVFWDCEIDTKSKERAAVALEGARAVFCDCLEVYNKCVSILGRPIKNFFIMPWGIMLPLPKQTTARQDVLHMYGIKTQWNFICPRGFNQVYDPVTLIKSFEILYKEGYDIGLIWTGEGEMKAHIADYVKSHGLSAGVIFTGKLSGPKLLEIYQAADCYVSCALSDGTSISMLEAMASGLPIIATNAYGNPGWISSNINGWLAQAGSSEEFVNVMRTAILTKKDELTRIGSQNIMAVNSRADWRLNFPSFSEFLTKLV